MIRDRPKNKPKRFTSLISMPRHGMPSSAKDSSERRTACSSPTRDRGSRKPIARSASDSRLRARALRYIPTLSIFRFREQRRPKALLHGTPKRMAPAPAKTPLQIPVRLHERYPIGSPRLLGDRLRRFQLQRSSRTAILAAQEPRN